MGLTDQLPGRPNQKVIVALDVDNRIKAMELVTNLASELNWFKVGMELFSAEGPQIVREISDAGAKVFVDLKFHDIPNTVARASAAITRLGAAMLNVHCGGGKEMMQRAVEAVREAAAQERIPVPKLIGVTVLTSMSQTVLTGEAGVNRELKEHVQALALLAKEAGLDGVVASPQEVEMIRAACGPEFIAVTPGVRPVWAALNDQKRVTTPAEALRLGSTHLVIGRPITGAPDPKAACRKILQEMSNNDDK